MPILWAALMAAESASPPLGLHVSTESAPPGATVQIKISLATPSPVSSGRLVMDFDPLVFGDVTAVAVFSGAGDAYGVANVQDRHLDAQFKCPSGGVGRLRELPVLTITIPVRVEAPRGTKAAVTVDVPGSTWKDPEGAIYAVTVTPGVVNVQGDLSVQIVTPGGGLLPSGSVVRIEGTGFTLATTVEVDGVAVAFVQFVGPREIDVTLGAPAEMTGKRIRLQNPVGSAVEYFSSLRGVRQGTSSDPKFLAAQPLFPLATYQIIRTNNYVTGAFQTGFALENQNLTSVDVTLETVYPPAYIRQRTRITLPSGALYVRNLLDVPGTTSNGGFVRVIASAPIRVLTLSYSYMPLAPVSAALPEPTVEPPRDLYVSPDSLSWKWQIGTAIPAATTLMVASPHEPGLDFTATSATTDGGQWLRVVPSAGSIAPSSSNSLLVSVDPTSLRAGVYTGTITVTPVGPSVQASTVGVHLTVGPSPFVDVCCTRTDLNAWLGQTTLVSDILPVTGTADNTPFSVTTTADAGGNWLSATPLSGTTPASITITANPTGLGAGTYYGTVTIQGPGNTQTISVDFVVADPTVLPVLETDARSLSFSVQEGAPSPQPRYLDVEPNYVLRTATASTESGGGWLSVDGGGAAPLFRVHANTIGLTADTYRGMVTVTAQGFVSAQVPVTLTVWKQAPVFFVSPSSLNFTVEYGGTAHLETVTVESQGVPVQFSVQRVTADGYPWLNGTALSDITPTTMPIAPTSTGVLPGTRHGSVTITGAGQSISIPITLTVTSNASMPPLIGAIVNAGSGIAGGVAPGEILAVHGVGIGSGQPAGLALDADGKVITSLSGARLLFDGIAAPLTYASVSQINAVVPYEVTGKDVTNIEVEYTGIRSRAWGVPVLAAAPAIFTLDYTGRGPAAVLNQDNSVNVPSNPAPRGSVIQIYGTGEGLTSPPSVTGTITQMDLKTPLLPVSVRIGGIDANLEYKGSAPDLVAGVIQVNAVVPYDVVPGPSVPIVLTVGGSRSPDGATIAVQ